ncbi:MAG: hypothetical protein JXO22_06925 [Phycisphaerae bacterium]|nr:hypothetical protein [Phycisphaerae bacterium]
MPSRSNRILVALAGSIICCALLGGCPVSTVDLPDDTGTSVLAPGSYWIEEDSGTLVYYELPETTADSGEWATLIEADTSWFSGPGWYALSEESEWERDASLDSLTLDDVIQTHDPVAAP